MNHAFGLQLQLLSSLPLWASRHHPKSYEQMPLREDILTTLRKVRGHAESLGGSDAIEHIYQATHTGSDASLLHDELANSGSIEDMVDFSLQTFK